MLHLFEKATSQGSTSETLFKCTLKHMHINTTHTHIDTCLYGQGNNANCAQILFALFASLIVEFMSGSEPQRLVFYVNLRLLLSCTHGRGQRTKDDNAYVDCGLTVFFLYVSVCVVCCFNFV